MPKPTTPLPQTLLALAGRQSTPVELLDRIAQTLPKLGDTALEVRMALVANASYPTAKAARLTWNLERHGRVMAAYARRDDIDDEELHRTAVALTTVTHRTPINALMELAHDPTTRTRVLKALVRVITAQHGYQHTQLAAHPNADAEIVVTILRRIVTKSGTHGKLPGAACVSAGLWTDLLRQLQTDHVAAAFDQIDSAALLGDLAECVPVILNDGRIERLAQIAVIDPEAWPVRRSSGAGVKHPLTRTVALLRDHAPLALRERCVAALTEAGVKVHGQDPREALALPTTGQRATASVGPRKFTAVARTLSSRPDVTDALAVELGALDDDQWDVFCGMADRFDGTVDALIDICVGIAATA